MSFSWWLKDSGGGDLFVEFGVHSQACGLGRNGELSSESRFSVLDIREAWCAIPFKEEFKGAARAALISVQEMARANLEDLESPHCETCTCREEPKGWSREAIEKLLSIPVERAWRAGGGY